MDTFATAKEELQRRSDDRLQQAFADPGYTLAQKVALTCRILFTNGQAVGLAGQITARMPDAQGYITQPFGMGLEEIGADKLLCVNENLEVVAGKGVPNPANRFHSWIYRARPDVRCIVHTHAPHSAALSMLEVPLQISHMDACPLYDDVAFLGRWPGVPHGNEEGRLIAEGLGDKRAILLSHHGLLIAGRSVEEACILALTFEHAARLQLLANAAGTIQPIEPALGAEAHRVMLNPTHVALSFAHQARRVLREHADCLA